MVKRIYVKHTDLNEINPKIKYKKIIFLTILFLFLIFPD